MLEKLEDVCCVSIKELPLLVCGKLHLCVNRIVFDKRMLLKLLALKGLIEPTCNEIHCFFPNLSKLDIGQTERFPTYHSINFTQRSSNEFYSINNSNLFLKICGQVVFHVIST